MKKTDEVVVKNVFMSQMRKCDCRENTPASVFIAIAVGLVCRNVVYMYNQHLPAENAHRAMVMDGTVY